LKNGPADGLIKGMLHLSWQDVRLGQEARYLGNNLRVLQEGKELSFANHSVTLF